MASNYNFSYDSRLAPYASFASKSQGRFFPEQESEVRTVFQRDRDRIVHSTAFRRLEYKTQVFVNHEGDHYRTRLTHSLEVAQITRTIARALGLSEDLAETLALAHDLGHPPFGHAGEEALNEMMQPFGGFDHNAHTLKLITDLEHHYAHFDGLNLTWETLEGIVKHNGPLLGRYQSRKSATVPEPILHYNEKHNLKLEQFASGEAQVASLADDIAYINHDLEDGIRAGLLSLAQLYEVPLIGESIALVEHTYPSLSLQRVIHEATRRLINQMVKDLIQQTFINIEEFHIDSVESIRNYHRPVVSFSETMIEQHLEIKRFLMEHLYRHYRVNRMTNKAKRVVKELFDLYFKAPNCLPHEWQEKMDKADSGSIAHIVADFIAGMTDRFAFREYTSLFEVFDQHVR